MKIAIMQPYVFPYLGYFQLIREANLFVLYDDVRFIKQGWINRNHILLKGMPHRFTVPLEQPSSNKLISETLVHPAAFALWRAKFLKTLAQAYKKAPCFDEVFALVEQVLKTKAASIAVLAADSIRATCRRLGIHTVIRESSVAFHNQLLQGQGRILDSCVKVGASCYINPIGGIALYSKAAFQEQNIELRFLKPHLTPYPQFAHPFVAGLSIIDVMMFNPTPVIETLLDDYSLC